MLLAVIALVLLPGCSDSSYSEEGLAPSGPTPVVTFDAQLAAELVQLAEDDQTGGATTEEERRARLKEIIDEHGWPTLDLVGKEGEDAAWLIAQHSDVDPEFQAAALELVRKAVADGQASPGNLAYLEDRVRAGRGEPQLYGTQTGCTRTGKPAKPAIEDPDQLDERREEAGLPPYDRYLRQMTRICRS